MVAVEVRDSLDPPLQEEIRRLVATVEARDAAPPLSDHARLLLAHPHAGVVHVTAHDDGQLTGYGQLEASSAELAVLAEADTLLAAIEQHAPADLLVWSHGRRSPVGPAAEARGYVRDRALWQLRRPLTDLPEARIPEGVTVRSFGLGRDEDAWLAVNAAAFAGHPEQAAWTKEDIESREAEPWFDPAGFLLAERRDPDGATLLGFHWTKMHPGRVGEVYVLGVAPQAQGLHLGSALLAAGLNHLAARGARDVLLYVDESNSGAMRLYEHADFARHDLDVQYRRPGPSTG